MRRIEIIVAVLMLLAATACTTPQAQRQGAIARAEALCIGKGKQFILGTVEQTGVIAWGNYYTTVSGQCVGPGEPGYVPRAPSK